MRPSKKLLIITLALALLTLAAIQAPVLASETVYASDVEKHWSKSYVWYLQRYGLVKGYPDGTFKPDQLVTKAEFTHMFMNVFNNQYTKTQHVTNFVNPAGSADKFTDAAAIPEWAKKSVDDAVKYGVINGNPDGSFSPGANITRAEAVAIVGRTLTAEYDLNQLDYFIDEIPEWVRVPLARVKTEGIVESTKDGLFKPGELVTRGELAKMFCIYYCGRDLFNDNDK